MKLLVAGDFCPRFRVAECFERGEYALVLSEVKDITSKVDYSIVNFECPIVFGEENPIEKLGPNLGCTRSGAEAIQYAGFNCVTLANNHFLDYGKEGVVNTLDTFNELHIDQVGGGVNLETASQILYKEINGERIAIINCCEHEYSIATESTAGSNPLNPIKQYYSIIEAKKNADYVMVIVHGGHEFFQLPSLRMVETYRFFVDAGADVVINHHQHCYSSYEVYKGRPIFYGLGNFCFDNPEYRNSDWNEGYFVTMELLKNNISFSIHPYYQCRENPHVELLAQDAFDLKLSKMSEIVNKPSVLATELDKYYRECGNIYSNILEPIQNYYYYIAKCRGLIRSLISKRRRLIATNYILCESHRDKLSYWLLSQLRIKDKS